MTSRAHTLSKYFYLMGKMLKVSNFQGYKRKLVRVQHATIELWMHLRGLLSTEEVGYRLVRLLRFFCA